MSNFYSLLVGIDCYLPNKLPSGLYYKSLRGCSQDIRRVENFLRNRLGVRPENIIELTSSKSDNREPPEPRVRWPTYANIVDGFKKVTEMARPGDQVFIQYSGHGGRAATTEAFHEVKGIDGIDEVLVPMDLGNSEGNYLRDTELHYLLSVMVDKALLVTLVLDSCHAGGATRSKQVPGEQQLSESGLRGIGAIDMSRRSGNSRVAGAEELIRAWRNSSTAGTRAARVGSGWLLEPQGYVLIAACRANEYANEVEFEAGEVSGALSYWLVDSLSRVGPDFTYKMLHDRILAKVHSQFVNQTPQLQGEGDRIVFGNEQVPRTHAIPIVSAIGQTVQLNAGRAQGLRPGVRLAVYPLYETNLSKAENRVAVVEVNECEAVTSTAKVLDRLGTNGIEPGCQAVVIESEVMRLGRRVRLVNSPVMASEGSAAMGQVTKYLEEGTNPFAVIARVDEPADYLVITTLENEYLITDPSGNPIPNLAPALSVNDPEAAGRLVKRIGHLAKYANVRDIENDSRSQLSRSLLLELTGVQKTFVPGDKPDPQPFVADGNAHAVNHGEWTFLKIENKYSDVLNITVLDLQPDWGITQIYPARAGAFEPIDPGKELVLPLRVSLPPGFESGTDIIKVFATIEPTSFRWLELPALDQPEAGNGFRGIPANPLENFLSMFTSVDVLTRKVEVPTVAEAEWVTHQVEIEIVRPG